MPAAEAFIDSNLLVLLAVGAVDRSQVGRHRRARRFVPEDYARLMAIVAALERVLVTPNTLTEASNLLRQHGEPERSLLMAGLRYLIEHSEEVAIPSARAAANPSFVALGITDAALLEAVSPQTPLITVDLDLYLAALERGESAAVNFREFMIGSL